MTPDNSIPLSVYEFDTGDRSGRLTVNGEQYSDDLISGLAPMGSET